MRSYLTVEDIQQAQGAIALAHDERVEPPDGVGIRRKRRINEPHRDIGVQLAFTVKDGTVTAIHALTAPTRLGQVVPSWVA